MNIYTSIILFILFGFSEQAISQNILKDKVFESGSKAHFDNYKKCAFYFECDCCSGKILFSNSNNFYLVNYCMSDFVLTKGTYKIEEDNVILSSDGSRIDVNYNWERESNPNAEPRYFVKDSTITAYKLNYKIDFCDKTMLVNQQEDRTYIAIETNLKISDELEKLRKFISDDILK